MELEEGRKRAEQQAAQLEEERQVALLAKEQLARHADENHKNREQMVSFFSLPFRFFSPCHVHTAGTRFTGFSWRVAGAGLVTSCTFGLDNKLQ